MTLTIKTTQIGKVLADAKGDTLYWYAKDMRGGPATCTGGCLTAWPVVPGKPLAAMGIAFAGKLGEVSDPNGTVQATYNGYPLYTYSGDMAPGETAGNGVGGVWHVISGPYLTTSTSAGAGSTGSSGSGSYGSGSGSGYGSGAKISGTASGSGSASKNPTSSGGKASTGGMGSAGGTGSAAGSGSAGGTGSAGNSGSNGAGNPTPVPTSSINGGGCGSGSCW